MQTKSHMGTGLANRDGRNRIRGVSKIGKRGYIFPTVPQNHNTFHGHMHHTSSEITSAFPVSLHHTWRHNLDSSVLDSSGLLLLPLWLNSVRFPIMCSNQHRNSFSWHLSHIASGFILNTPHRYFHCFFWALITENVPEQYQLTLKWFPL